jgi:glutaredoxin
MSKEEFYTLTEKHQTPKTVPKIFSGDELIGGYEDLVDWIENHAGGYGDGSLS